MHWCEKMHTASWRQLQIHVPILVIMWCNQKINMLLRFQSPSMRVRPGSAGQDGAPRAAELGKRWQMGQKAWHLLSARAESLALPITPSYGKSETLVLFKGHLVHAYFPAWEKGVAKLKSWISSYLSNSKSPGFKWDEGAVQTISRMSSEPMHIGAGENLPGWFSWKIKNWLKAGQPCTWGGSGQANTPLCIPGIVTKASREQQGLEVASELLKCQGWKASLGM